MRILVTGANGQVGTELTRQGIQSGHKILATGHKELDISQPDAVNNYIQAQQPDIVINAAAYTAVDKAESESEQAYAINRDGAANLAQACANNQIPLLHISTDYVFDGVKHGSYSETDKPNPQTIYGKSKLAGDLVIASVLQQHLILRVSWVFGSTGNNFVKTMLRLGKQHDLAKAQLRVVTDQHGGPTWSGDIAATLFIIAKRWHEGEKISWGSYHYSGQPATTWHAFADVIFAQAKTLGIIEQQPEVKAINTTEYPTPAQRPLNSVFNCQKITRELGITQSDWRNGLDNVLLQLYNLAK